MGNLNISGRTDGTLGTGAAALTRVDGSSTNSGGLVDASATYNFTDASGAKVSPVFVHPDAMATLASMAPSCSSGFRVETDPTGAIDRLIQWATQPPQQHPVP